MKHKAQKTHLRFWGVTSIDRIVLLMLVRSQRDRLNVSHDNFKISVHLTYPILLLKNTLEHIHVEKIAIKAI